MCKQNGDLSTYLHLDDLLTSACESQFLIKYSNMSLFILTLYRKNKTKTQPTRYTMECSGVKI